ncbi:hypothetical protein EDC02_5236 [Micromonospora sp. Llam0]|uniref:hypothetical protein n=1 Tax=Micromonospora sp. Llam0 TaxID=2485143 RepID=UPI000F4A7D39|nr:hypothetical protein [Micromonospora sp. Llam0]ROO63216.1 hypothetical protein EDC02_5236 [Micromonospora sp. Llam0]
MRRRTPTRRGLLVLIVQCVIVQCVALLLTPAPSAAAPADPTIPPRNVPTETGKYYVVGPAVDGQREFLFAIAAETLGDGSRYREIFELNKGRPQPDGRQMVGAATVEPGWILILPADAAGPDVQTGALPEPIGSTAGPDGPGTPAGDSGGWFSTGLRIALLVLAVVLVVWARVALAARRSAVAESAASSRAAADGRVGPVTTQRRLAAPPPDLGAADLLPPTPPNPFGTLITELDCGGRPAQVRLVGTRPARWGQAYGWLPAGRRLPPSAAALVLGERDGMRLWADLDHAPDALTIVGDPAAARSHAATLMAQLGRDAEVVVTGDVLGGEAPGHARWIPVVTDLGPPGSPARPQVVVCSAADAPALREQLRRLAGDGTRTVPVIVGPAPEARWSIRMPRQPSFPPSRWAGWC